MLSLSCPKNCYFIHFGISVLEQNKNHLYGIWFLTCFKSVSKIFTMKSLFWCTDTFSDHTVKLFWTIWKFGQTMANTWLLFLALRSDFDCLLFLETHVMLKWRPLCEAFLFSFPLPSPPTRDYWWSFLKILVQDLLESYTVYKILDKILMNILNDPWMVLTRAKLKL